jgi:hypothetical protein
MSTNIKIMKFMDTYIGDMIVGILSFFTGGGIGVWLKYRSDDKKIDNVEHESIIKVLNEDNYRLRQEIRELKDAVLEYQTIVLELKEEISMMKITIMKLENNV